MDNANLSTLGTKSQHTVQRQIFRSASEKFKQIVQSVTTYTKLKFYT